MGKDLKGKEIGRGISQRKDGSYCGRYTDRFGKRRSIYSRNLSELRKDLAIAVSENLTFTSIRQEIKLDDWFKRWMEVYKEKSIRPNTKRHYTHVYNKNISPYLGNRKINMILKSDVQQLIDMADEQGYKYETQSKIRLIILDMFNRAIEDELVTRNPARGVKIRCEKENNVNVLTLEEQETFFRFAQGSFYYNMFQVAVNTGLRPGELYALQLEDIDLENGFINVNKTLVYQKYLGEEHKTFHIEPPKTKQSYRKVPINSVCRVYLLKQMELKKVVSSKRPKEKNDFLFVTQHNTPINAVLYNGAIGNVVYQINLTRSVDDALKKISGHTFRHTFATRCFEAGVQPKVVQSYLGHASIEMTMNLYTHVTEDKASDDIERIVPDAPKNIIDFQTRIS